MSNPNAPLAEPAEAALRADLALLRTALSAHHTPDAIERRLHAAFATAGCGRAGAGRWRASA